MAKVWGEVTRVFAWGRLRGLRYQCCLHWPSLHCDLKSLPPFRWDGEDKHPQEPSHKANCRADGFLRTADVCCFAVTWAYVRLAGCKNLKTTAFKHITCSNSVQISKIVLGIVFMQLIPESFCQLLCRGFPSEDFQKEWHFAFHSLPAGQRKAGAALSKYHMHIHAFSAPGPPLPELWDRALLVVRLFSPYSKLYPTLLWP